MGSEVETASANAVDSDSESVSWEDFYGEWENALSNLIFSLSFILEKRNPRSTAHAPRLYVYYCFYFFFSTRVSRNALYFVYGAEAIQVRARILET